MIKRAIGFIPILLLSLVWTVCSNAEEIYSPYKIIRSDIYNAYLQGRWKETTKGQLKRLARINSAYITCNKMSTICIENTAVLYTPEDDPNYKAKNLAVVSIEYRIINWSDDIINAKYEGIAADIEIRISLRDKFAERRFRETKARGSESADPNLYAHWILE